MAETRWVFFDANGTLLYLDRVFERLQARLREKGHLVPLADVEHAARAEFAYYVSHSVAARDEDSLWRFRLRCGAVLLEAFSQRGVVLPLSPAEAIQALLCSLEFRLFPDVLPAFATLRAAGVRLGVISNWDCTLPHILLRLGLGQWLEVTVVSALCGTEKPHPGIFHEALKQAGAPPGACVHVGDSVEKDVRGAQAAGMRAVWLDRRGTNAALGSVPRVGDLHELTGLLAGCYNRPREHPC
ncbi:MAG: HAD-IA family hydrolase [Armatimonadota bacterium]|nr:HAD-IA family hydrolase [Armatimonadota bacterium]